MTDTFLFVAVWCSVYVYENGEILDSEAYDRAYQLFKKELLTALRKGGRIPFLCRRIDLHVPENDVHRSIHHCGWLFIIEVAEPFLPQGHFNRMWLDCCVKAGAAPYGGSERYFDQKACITDIMNIHKDVI